MYSALFVLMAACLPTAESFLPSFPTTVARSTSTSEPSFLLWSTASEGSPDGGNTATTTRPPVPKVHRLQSLDDFLNYIDSAPQDSLAVIKYYANSCPLCKRIELKYKKMSRFYQTAPIQFAEIEKTAHPDLFPTLGVDTYPYIQIYRNGQCVAAHGTESDKTFEPMVNDTIQRELLMEPGDWESFLTAFAAPIQASTNKVNTLRTLQQQQQQQQSTSAQA